MGSEGEDVVADEGGGLKLACPARFQPGTMKAAAWQVSRSTVPYSLSPGCSYQECLAHRCSQSVSHTAADQAM